jgi:hypothetical protein
VTAINYIFLNSLERYASTGTQVQSDRCILCVASVLGDNVELLPAPFLFGPKPLGEPFPFLCLLRGFFFTPFGVFPAK